MLVGSLLAAALGCGSALTMQNGGDPEEVAPGASEVVAPRMFRQALDNDQDLQYFGNMTVGGQLVKGIFDTGSIEFAVLSKACDVQYCGSTKPLYDSKSSNGYKHGPLELQLSYGSGSLFAHEAYDTVLIGDMQASIAPFWEVVDADMVLLIESSFNAIVGLGPIPSNVEVLSPNHRELGDKEHLFAVLQKRMMIEKFSVCLGREPGSYGYLTWNDNAAERMPKLFSKLHVPDSGYWMAKIKDVKLGNFRACRRGCGAVVDSGTSLLAAPAEDMGRLSELINSMVGDCGSLEKLPDLTFTLDGQKYSLPPDSYVGEVFNEAPEELAKNFKLARSSLIGAAPAAKKKCEASLMEIGMSSDLGPVWILGVPFFRKYYTIFEQATPASPPAIYTALASDRCLPHDPRESEMIGGYRQGTTVRKIDASRLRVGHWIHRATASGTSYMQAEHHIVGRTHRSNRTTVVRAKKA